MSRLQASSAHYVARNSQKYFACAAILITLFLTACGGGEDSASLAHPPAAQNAVSSRSA